MLKLTLLIVVVMVICGQATPRPQFGFGGASSFSSAGGIGSFSGAGGGAGVFTGTGGRPGVFPGAGGFGGFGNFGGFGHYGGFGVPFYQPQFINPASFIPQINIPAMPNMVSQAGGVHIFKDGEEITSTFDDTTGTNYQSFFMTTTSDGKNPPKTHMYVNNNGKKIVEEY